jgi:hypothetical protein
LEGDVWKLFMVKRYYEEIFFFIAFIYTCLKDRLKRWAPPYGGKHREFKALGALLFWCNIV